MRGEDISLSLSKKIGEKPVLDYSVKPWWNAATNAGVITVPDEVAERILGMYDSLGIAKWGRLEVRNEFVLDAPSVDVLISVDGDRHFFSRDTVFPDGAWGLISDIENLLMDCVPKEKE